MHNKQAFESGNKGGCGSFGRGKFGGPWGGPFGRGKGWGDRGHHAWGTPRPPVNIEETDTAYVISLYAAGLVKDRVKLTVKDDVLTVSYLAESTAAMNSGTEPSEGANSPADSYTYQEFSSQSFERQFRLNNKVLTESISATYTDGILRVTLPKNPATNVPAQTITVG